MSCSLIWRVFVPKRNIAASVRARLLNYSRASKQDFSYILLRFCLERLLYRLTLSNYADRFLLKGALLFELWFDIPHRATRDADLLGYGAANLTELEHIFKEICAIQPEVEDGVIYDTDSLSTTELRQRANYPGVRVTFNAKLDGAVSKLQVDIGFGDAVVPAPSWTMYPALLEGLTAPRIRTYSRYTVIAEKFQTLCFHGIANSRMKDYYDLWFLGHNTELAGELLCQAMQATFQRRETNFPAGIPVGLTEKFSRNEQKQVQWNAFVRRNALAELSLFEVTNFLADFLLPVARAAQEDSVFTKTWSAKGYWQAGQPVAAGEVHV